MIDVIKRLQCDLCGKIDEVTLLPPAYAFNPDKTAFRFISIRKIDKENGGDGWVVCSDCAGKVRKLVEEVMLTNYRGAGS